MRRRYPEHEKLLAIQSQSQTIGEFIEWWTNEEGMVPCKNVGTSTGETELMVLHRRISDVLAKYFSIDLQKIEDEKRLMLADLRAEVAP